MIETKRLLLREMTLQDFDALHRILTDPDVMQHYPHAFDEAEVQGWIKKNIQRYQTFGFGLWAVCLKDTGEMIGDCGLTMQLIGTSEKATPKKRPQRCGIGPLPTRRFKCSILI